VTDYSRQQFYESRRNYQTFGAEGLVDRLFCRARLHINTWSDANDTANPRHHRSNREALWCFPAL
jgi:hypothetical protein